MSSDAQQTAAVDHSTDTEYIRIEQRRLRELQGSTQELAPAADLISESTDEIKGLAVEYTEGASGADNVVDSDPFRGLVKNEDVTA